MAYSFAVRKARSQDDHKAVQGKIKIALLVPFRNEAANLGNLILDIQIQSYPSHLFEVIFINDHSEDESVKIIKQLAQQTDNLRIIHLPDHQFGKKAAISKGVREAGGDWIIQTDADCRLPRGFVSEHARYAEQNSQSFIAGPVLLNETNGLWNKFEVLEFMSLTASTMGSFFTGSPIMCNGANISYGREFFLRNEMEIKKINSPSGDDMFLLSRAKSEGLKMTFLVDHQSVVNTDTCGSLLSFLSQRVRWGSKVRYYRDKDILYMAGITFLSSASILGLLIYGLTDISKLYLFGSFLLLKSLADLFILIVAVKKFQKLRLLWYFPFVALFYYFYLVITGTLSLVSGFRWKGRKY